MAGRFHSLNQGNRCSFSSHCLVIAPADLTEEFAEESAIYQNIDIITVGDSLQYYKKRSYNNSCGSYDQTRITYFNSRPKIDIYSISGFPCRSAIINEYYFYRKVLYQQNTLFTIDSQGGNIYRNGKVFCSFPLPIYGFCITDDYAIALCYEYKTDYSVATYFDREFHLSISGNEYTDLGARYNLVAYQIHLINHVPERDLSGNIIDPVRCADAYTDSDLIGMRSPWSISVDGTQFSHVDHLSRYLYRGSLSGIDFNTINKTELADPVNSETVNTTSGYEPSTFGCFYVDFSGIIPNSTTDNNGTLVQNNYYTIDEFGQKILTGQRTWTGTVDTTISGYLEVLSLSANINAGYAAFCYDLERKLTGENEPAVIDTIDIVVTATGSFSGSASNWNTQIAGTLSVTISGISRKYGEVLNQSYSKYLDLVNGTNSILFSDILISFTSGYLIDGAGGGSTVSGSVSFSQTVNVTASFASARGLSGYAGGVTIDKGGYYESTLSNTLLTSFPFARLNQRGTVGTSGTAFQNAFMPNLTIPPYQYPIPGTYSGFEFSDSNTFSNTSQTTEEANCIVGVDYLENSEIQIKIQTTQTTTSSSNSAIQFSAQPTNDFTDFDAQSTTNSSTTSSTFKRYVILKDSDLIYEHEYTSTYTSGNTRTNTDTIQGPLVPYATERQPTYQHAPLFLDVRYGIYWLLQTKYLVLNAIESKLISIKPVGITETLVDHTQLGMVAVERSFVFRREDNIDRRMFIPCGGYASIFSSATLPRKKSQIDFTLYHHNGYSLTSYHMDSIFGDVDIEDNFNAARFESGIDGVFCIEEPENSITLLSLYPNGKQLVLNEDLEEIEREVQTFFPIRVL